MVIQKLQEKLYILKGRTIGLLGLAFKPDTDDLRDAPALHIAERLMQMGARVKAYDPVANAACREQRPDLKMRYCDTARELASDADALVLVTEWREFYDLDLAALARLMANPILVDGRNFFVPETAVAAGFDYSGIGRCTPRPHRPTRGSYRGSRSSGPTSLCGFPPRIVTPTAVPNTSAPGTTRPVTSTCDPREGTPFPEITNNPAGLIFDLVSALAHQSNGVGYRSVDPYRLVSKPRGSALMRPIVIVGAHPASTTAATATLASFSFMDSSSLPETHAGLSRVSPYNMEDAVSQKWARWRNCPGFCDGGDGGRPAVCGVPCRAGAIRALSGVCLHSGGPLGQGQIHDGCVVCPYHLWEFDCATGEYDYDPTKRVPTFEVKVEDGDIYIQVP